MLDTVMPLLSHLLVPMFLIGMAGSSIIVVVTLASDLTDFLSDNGNEETNHEGLS